MTFEEYERLFKGSMPRLNWDRGKLKGWRVEQTVVDDRDALADWKILITEGGVYGDKGRHIRLGRVQGNMDLFGKDWRPVAFKLAEQYELEDQKISLIVPALGRVVFDGCHRLVALMLSRVEFGVLICSARPRDGVISEIEDWL